MGESETGKKKKYKVRLDVDLNAVLTGFDTAKTPTRAHRRLLKHYSSVLFCGPPPSDDLLEMMTHMYTDDEADAAQHLPPYRPRTAAQIARKCGRSAEDVARHLDNCADNKHVIVSWGEPKKYTILPVVPGTFEMALMTPDLSTANHWHKKFADIFHRVWDTGFLTDYLAVGPPLVRYLPVPGPGDTLHMAWPSEKLEEILEPYNLFAVGNCQCRVSMQLSGKGCHRPTENCVAIGPGAKGVIDRGLMRQAGKDEILEIKRNAEQSGCVTWMMNEKHDHRGQVSCSCCGCCCHGLRTMNQFSAPGLVSKPHFLPRRDDEACNICGKCATACPMGAVKRIASAMFYDEQRCIGCGLCALACKFNAIEMKAVPGAPEPESDMSALFYKSLPGFLTNSFKLWLRRTMKA
ncbi:ATP-binding protein [bacterium]